MKITFIYNAESGKLNAVKDFLHKTIRPDTYSCNLCKLTYGARNMKDDWKQFIDGLPYEVEFLHLDDLHENPFAYDGPFPVVLKIENNTTEVLLSTEQLNAAQTLDALIAAMTQALEV